MKIDMTKTEMRLLITAINITQHTMIRDLQTKINAQGARGVETKTNKQLHLQAQMLDIWSQETHEEYKILQKFKEMLISMQDWSGDL